MNQDEVTQHWQDWATRYGGSLRATTKTSTIKALELDALRRAFERSRLPSTARSVLEVGCGNGHNCLALAEAFPTLDFTGIDIVEDMVVAARELAAKTSNVDRLKFFKGDALRLDDNPDLLDAYDIAFTDRCLINLTSTDKQLQAIGSLAKRVRTGGYLVLIENSWATYSCQNECREILGLAKRTPDKFNLFFDDEKIVPHLERLFDRVEIEDFGSLHDLVLYVLCPALNEGRIDYDNPMVKLAATLSSALSPSDRGRFGQFGQNRLYFCGPKT